MLALGDSYTIGESEAPEQRWHEHYARLRTAAGKPTVVVAMVAETAWATEELWAAIDEAVGRGEVADTYDRVSLLIGVNNQYRGRPAETYESDFEALLERSIAFAGGDRRKVFVLSIPDWGVTPYASDLERAQVAVEIDQYNAVAAATCGRFGVAFVDITGLSRAHGRNPQYLAHDGLHPSGLAYQAWAQKALDETD